ncbi:MAG TPA: peptide-methionine (S)-S-oxide reductase MsrA [Accumulibacter sp.]|jgi:peptide-methionine (S)-S-oxide reductase|nr:peptide-methionine (S)-S-oxide reductase MsrA [Accumulibacter sp.]HQC80452.1 peptide-methionine (S)-S-oxide reductase MsrA [Accumulibacter sp.]
MKINRLLKILLAFVAVAVGLAACTRIENVSRHRGGQTATAIFAGGCFWCMQRDFEQLSGVVDVEAGYTGGWLSSPNYEAVSLGDTGHTEAVRVYYDPTVLSYRQLVDYFWRHIDPTVKNRQFCDIGSQYRSAIYWQDDEQRQIAMNSLAALLNSGRFKMIYTEMAPAAEFWPAEDYHQGYARKNPLRYNYYRFACGRDARVAEVWGSVK